MIRRIAALALASFTCLGFASTAWAHHPSRQAYNEREFNLLVDAVQSTGHEIFVDDPYCDTKEGLFGLASYDKRLLVCTKNHHEDPDELADTVRHESIHLVQYCKGRNNGATIATLYPENAELYLKHAVERLHMPLISYSPKKYATEAEARVLAHYLNEDTVAYLLDLYCVQGKKD